MRITNVFYVLLTFSILAGCGGSGNGAGTLPLVSAPDPPPTVSLTDREQAALFLQRATFGPSEADVDELLAIGKEAWIDQQLVMSDCQPQYQADQVFSGDNLSLTQRSRLENWWTRSMTCDNQLRQRVAWALSQIMVVSDGDLVLLYHQDGLADYYDTLLSSAFGSYRALLTQVSLHPAMGSYLNMLGNEKANPDKNIFPDENYAREVMQLFSIGLHQLNTDGSVKLDASGNPVPTYGQDDIRELARVLTGWSWRGMTAASWEASKAQANPDRGRDYLNPMVTINEYHDFDGKTVLGQTFPADQDAYTELLQVMDLLTRHPSTAPFISKQLIQRLVKSNPTPAYVGRVVQVWKRTSGNLGQVVKAILLDTEAQTTIDSRLVEPVMRFTQIWRAFDATPNANGEYHYYSATANMGQSPLSSPSVFNFYQPGYAPAGLPAGMVAPEFALIDANYYPRMSNDLADMVMRVSRTAYSSKPDYTRYAALLESDGLEKTVSALSDLLVPGATTDYDRTLVTYANEMKTGNVANDAIIANLVKQIILSPQYAIQ